MDGKDHIVPHFIDGQFVVSNNCSSGQVIHNPATGKIIGRVNFADTLLIEQAVTAAKMAFPKWAAIIPLRRARILFKFKELLETHIDELAALITREHGKILIDAKGSILRGIELIEFFCGIPQLLKGSYSENVGSHIDSYTVRQPLGICISITPFNFPVMVPIWMMIPAIACGNTFILKPSEKDPSVSLRLVELFHLAGLPAGVCNVLQGDKSTVDQLITHPDIVAVSCVGSTPVAEHIYQVAVAHGKRAHTFGGSKNHCVIMPDADLDNAAEEIVGAAYGSAGERCMAISAVVAITEKVGDALVEKLLTKIRTIKVGSGDDETSQMGPLITREHWQRVKQYVDQGVAEGAQLLVDGRELKVPHYEQGFFMGPCLFDWVRPEMHIYKEEIFGPVLVVLRVSDLNQALELVNTHQYGNGVSIFTQNGGIARDFATQVQVGMVGINVPIPVPVAYHSFGGWKRSWFGDVHLHGSETVNFYTKPKSVTVRWPKQSITAFYQMPAH